MSLPADAPGAVRHPGPRAGLEMVEIASLGPGEIGLNDAALAGLREGGVA